MVTDSSWLVTLSVLFPSLSVFSIFIYLSSVPGRGVWRGRRSVAECGMAWERQSDPGLRWQLCYDFSARSWWMVGRMLPVSPSFCIDQSVCFSSLLFLFFSFHSPALVCTVSDQMSHCCRMWHFTLHTVHAACFYTSEETVLSHLLYVHWRPTGNPASVKPGSGLLLAVKTSLASLLTLWCFHLKGTHVNLHEPERCDDGVYIWQSSSGYKVTVLLPLNTLSSSSYILITRSFGWLTPSKISGAYPKGWEFLIKTCFFPTRGNNSEFY